MQKQEMDITQLSNQVAQLKHQRNQAMDDLAVIVGQNHSLKEDVEIWKAKYEEELQKNSHGEKTGDTVAEPATEG